MCVRVCVLETLLYLIFPAADVPVEGNSSLIATFADDAALIFRDVQVKQIVTIRMRVSFICRSIDLCLEK